MPERDVLIRRPTCEHCGDTGSVRVHGSQDYGVSFESELCDKCDYGRGLIDADTCIWEGHDWKTLDDFRRCTRCLEESDV